MVAENAGPTVVYRVVYTKDGHKRGKNRRWKDGMLAIRMSTMNSGQLPGKDKNDRRMVEVGCAELRDEEANDILATVDLQRLRMAIRAAEGVDSKVLTQDNGTCEISIGSEFEIAPRILVVVDERMEDVDHSGQQCNAHIVDEKNSMETPGKESVNAISTGNRKFHHLKFSRPRRLGPTTEANSFVMPHYKKDPSEKDSHPIYDGVSFGKIYPEQNHPRRTNDEIMSLLGFYNTSIKKIMKSSNNSSAGIDSSGEGSGREACLKEFAMPYNNDDSEDQFSVEFRKLGKTFYKGQKVYLEPSRYQELNINNSNLTEEKNFIVSENKENSIPNPMVTQPKPSRAFRPLTVRQHNTKTIQSSLPMNQNGIKDIEDNFSTIKFLNEKESMVPKRTVVIPDSFDSISDYQKHWKLAIFEEISLRLADVAKRFHNTVNEYIRIRKVERANEVNVEAMKSMMQKSGVQYHGECKLFIWNNCAKFRFQNGKATKNKKRKIEYYEDASDVTSEQTYLILESGRQKNAEYHKGDVWIIASHPFMQRTLPKDSGQHWVAIVQSLWHGPNQDGKFEIEWLSPKPSNLGRQRQVYALKGVEAYIELGILELLKGGVLEETPLIPYLLAKKRQEANASKNHDAMHKNDFVSEMTRDPDFKPELPIKSDQNNQAYQHAKHIISSFKLNTEQADVLYSIAGWAVKEAKTTSGAVSFGQNHKCEHLGHKPPVCLIHGPFGTGKSTLLVAILHLIMSLRNLDGEETALSNARVLVSAHTNVAVDRVLTGLLDRKCTDFLRVGPLRRIARCLLPHSLHASDSQGKSSGLSELKEMIKEASSAEELLILREELKLMSQGAERKRRKRVNTAPIVGVTCCSSLLSVLDGQTFDVVVLDECSQMIEPLSLLPCIRSKCRFLIAAGDPKQLPPVVASPTTISPDLLANRKLGRSISGEEHPISQSRKTIVRPLFVRLEATGINVHFLKRQYRCHPSLSSIPNNLFYQSRLIDGCSPADRKSLFPGLPSVVAVDVKGVEKYLMGRSIANLAEAASVVRVLRQAVGAGIAPARIGVICFFKAQVAVIKSKLKSDEKQAAFPILAETLSPAGGAKFESTLDSSVQPQSFGEIQVATVDAFQGAEKDVIVLTTSTTKSSNFTSDSCRLNVALTRARHNLIVIGHTTALQECAEAFALILKSCKSSPGGFSTDGKLPLASK